MRVRHPELRELVAAARRAGWQVDRTRGGHLRFRRPGHPTVVAPSTPSDYRAVANTRADLRRAGLDQEVAHAPRPPHPRRAAAAARRRL